MQNVGGRPFAWSIASPGWLYATAFCFVQVQCFKPDILFVNKEEFDFVLIILPAQLHNPRLGPSIVLPLHIANNASRNCNQKA